MANKNRLYKVLKIINDSDEKLDIHELSYIIKIERRNLQVSLIRYIEDGFIEPVILKEPGLLKGHFEETIIYDITNAGKQMIDLLENSEIETKTYHIHNHLKYLIFDALFNNCYPKYASPNEIAEMINEHPTKVRDMLQHYLVYGYVSRRKGKCHIKNRMMYKYRIKLLGVQTYSNLHFLYTQGRELNLRKKARGKSLQKVDSYIGVSKAGFDKMISEGNDMDIISVDCVEIC